jgi:hypothetical protein
MALQGQVNAILAQQGATPIERDLLTSPVVEHDAAGGGTSETYRVRLASGTIAFHKPFTGVDVVLADDFGHEDPDQVPINEAAAWRLAAALGKPVSRLVCVCVLRTIAYEPGSLSLRVPGEPWSACDGRQAGLSEIPYQASAAAFFDSLVAQQDRHNGNFFFDGETLGLIDHGFTFARPGDHLNYTNIVEWRHNYGDPTLTTWEHAALDRLLAGRDLLGLRAILHPDRAAALEDRAQRIKVIGRILRPGRY